MTETPEEKALRLKHGTKEEAQRRYDEKVERINTTMCPLRDNICRRSCVCCDELKIVNIGSKEAPFWECHGGFCTAYMLIGPT